MPSPLRCSTTWCKTSCTRPSWTRCGKPRWTRAAHRLAKVTQVAAALRRMPVARRYDADPTLGGCRGRRRARHTRHAVRTQVPCSLQSVASGMSTRMHGAHACNDTLRTAPAQPSPVHDASFTAAICLSLDGGSARGRVHVAHKTSAKPCKRQVLRVLPPHLQRYRSNWLLVRDAQSGHYLICVSDGSASADPQSTPLLPRSMVEEPQCERDRRCLQ
mmetsp:Transcript_3833/g.14234  ORF Transcript_3833/g.14234 Transcript_3833/m.14234 type:complete len:217 (-) Transcript_3833:3263-3913(-)